ncbi:hypothetical protein SAMN05421805_105282 [Saccharopolyspora antimicrobica]|uniref:UPF0182 protein ATL45_1515 n=2 Tax=Saccharopolyspora antimicrobica TaxID=455193 RepID=A0A1I5A8Y9_9PSEU|nr:hypothetical protein ATL45_1515 [Saccharopolyspora antimicrobica]SFN58609.1 hypothetical protein SAMN05421805_105282 [Saccharopolyspora antimicrobica]
MAMRPPVGMPKLSRRSRILLILGGIVLVALIAGSRMLGTYVDWLWYGEVGYRGVFTTQLFSRAGLGVAAAVFLGLVLGLNLWVAYRNRPVFVPVSGPDDPLARYRTVATERSRLFGLGIPIVVGVIGGLAAQADWQTLQLFLHSVPFGQVDPEFGKDISFYTFELPFWRLLLSWAFIAVTVSFIGALITHYIFGGIRLAGRSGQLSMPARVQLAILAGLFVLFKAVDYFLDRYDLLLSQRNSLFTGASYTDLNAVMPAKLILMCIAVFCALAFFAVIFLKNVQIPALAAVLLVLSSVVVGAVWPALLEQFSVRPNANQREAQSIERNLQATKAAFGIGPDKVEITDYPGRTQLQPHEVAEDKGTIPNIRLLDPNVLAPTFTQLTQQYNFYGFTDKLDVDRYRDAEGNVRDYLVALRELNTDGLAVNQQNWINRHTVYTHGNGFVAAPADRVDSTFREGATQGGYPVFQISDVANNGQGAIPVEQPRVYYGELVGRNDYVIVGGNAGEAPREYDTDQQQYTYTGMGGVPVGNLFQRLVFGAYYGERNFLFSGVIGDQSKIIYERNPRDRVQKVAPWLKLDGDPYPAVINGRIKWIVDGYTTLNNYPYSQLTELGEATNDTLTGVERLPNQQINYIRNSVKATVDAYDGNVDLYAVDEQDPVLKAWQGVFPGVVKPASEITPELRDHFRYPEDIFKVQRKLLTEYHVDNPGDFFSTQTFWEVPSDPTSRGNVAGSEGQQPPYYVLAQIGEQKEPTFQLTSALTALRRQNMSAWVSASSDPDDYGKLSVLRLPTNTLTPGPNQVQNQMESTPEVTENRTLFNNPNVNAIFGNLLTLPVAGGLLYVEPIYIQRNEQESYPQLARVLVSFGGKVGFSETLQGALDQVFGSGAGQATQTEDPQRPPAPGQQPPPPGQDTSSPEMSQAVGDIRAALEHVRKAQQSGNFGDLGSAYQELDDAIRRFEQAQGNGG